jgi:hypothetical protein
VEKVAFPETLYGNALLMESEYESIAKMALDSAERFSALDRPGLRKVIRQTLQLRQRRINSGRYPNLPPLSTVAIGILNGPSDILANPTDTWFLKSFYPRTAKYGLMKKTPKYTDVQRTATYNATKLVADMESVLAELSDPKINIMSADGKWVPSPDDPSWDPGYCSRARYVQTDEKGEFIAYNYDGVFRRLKVAAGKHQRAVIAMIEDRNTFSFVPWVDANGELLFFQLIFKLRRWKLTFPA